MKIDDFIDQGLIRADNDLTREEIERIESLTDAEIDAIRAVGMKLGYPAAVHIAYNYGKKGGIIAGIF